MTDNSHDLKMPKISWPSASTTFAMSLFVVAALVILGMIVFGLDAAFAEFMRWMFETLRQV